MNPKRLLAALSLLVFALPAWSAGLQMRSVRTLSPVRPAGHLTLAKPKPVILGASYHVARSCTNPLHAFTVTVRIRNEGGPLKANVAHVQIGATDVNSIWNAYGIHALLPAMAPGQIVTTRQWVGALPSYRKSLPGAHTLSIEMREKDFGDLQHPFSTYSLQVTIPRGYCQPQLRAFNSRQAAVGVRRFNPSAAAALKPKVHLVSLRMAPAEVRSGQPVSAYVVVRNDGGLASKPKKLWIYCAAYANQSTPPTMYTCKVPSPLKGFGGMPVWVIPLPSIPAHGQMDAALRIAEHWPVGRYSFAHRVIDGTTTVAGLTNEATTHVVAVTAP